MVDDDSERPVTTMQEVNKPLSFNKSPLILGDDNLSLYDTR